MRRIERGQAFIRIIQLSIFRIRNQKDIFGVKSKYKIQ